MRIQTITAKLHAIRHCTETLNAEWSDRHANELTRIVSDYPGLSLCPGSTAERVAFVLDGKRIRVTASLVFGFKTLPEHDALNDWLESTAPNSTDNILG